MNRGLVAVVAVLVVTSLVAVGTIAAAPGGMTVTAAQQEFDRVEFHITVHDNGSARWTFRYGTELQNQSQIDQFEAYADRFENESTPLYEDFQSQAADLTARGANVTGREMEARAFSKQAYTRGLGPSNRLGVVEMSFTWTNFARVDGDRVVVGDVFEDGLYIGSGQEFVAAAGGSLRVASADPEPDDRSNETVSWRGSREFDDERPRVVFEPQSASSPTTTTTTVTDTTTTTTTDASVGAGADSGTVPWLVVTAVAALLVIGAVMAWQRVGDRFGGSATGGDEPGDGGASDPEPAIPDEEMMTDEERVLGLLRENGGRMRQVNIVEETGWSKSKVSMLLSDMEDEGQVTKLRVGRENIVSLPGKEPDASGSPYDDDE